MVKALNNQTLNVATQIYEVFQSSYQVEAELIGVSDFPPLQRSVNDIMMADKCFTGFYANGTLAAVVETELINQVLDIHSLTVAPEFFGQGIGKRLMQFVLHREGYEWANVETAVLNLPAINLYKKLGFAEVKRWIPSHGIEKVAFRKTLNSSK